MAVAACNINFVNAYMTAYCVHVYTCSSLIHSPNPNLDSYIKYSLSLVLTHTGFRGPFTLLQQNRTNWQFVIKVVQFS